jgi:beta-glucosidase
VLYTITAQIKNTGALQGDEVPQLYVSLGGADNPPVVLRGFERLTIDVGETVTFCADLTRRDLSNWDTTSQNWVITDDEKTVFVGPSSRKLVLSQALN